LYDLPEQTASRIIFSEIEKLIERKMLIETYELSKERLYLEGNALNKPMKFSNSRSNGVTYREMLEGLRRKRIANFIIRKHVENNQLNNDTFNAELDKLFSDGFDPERSKGSTTYMGIFDRPIKDDEFEFTIQDFVKNKNLNIDEIIMPPFMPIGGALRFNDKISNYTTEEWNTLVNDSVAYNKKYYLNYKEMIELNFPTCKSSFETYKSFPMHIIAVQNFGKKLAAKHIFGGVSDQKDPVKITLIDDPDEKKIERMVPSYKHHSIMYWGLFSDKMFGKEPLRRSMYELIEKEYRKLK
jgi:hypothetical protein